jgi:ABC-type amino acid transport substrate-binding protein
MLVVMAGALIGSTAWGQQPLKAGGQDAKPWVLHNQNELSGVAIDLTGAISKQIGVPIEYQPMIFADLIPAVDSGKIDVIATNMAITPEREQKLTLAGRTTMHCLKPWSCNRATQRPTGLLRT